MTQSPAPERREVLAFIAVGALNTAFGYAVYAILILLGFEAVVALAIATVIGVLFNFWTKSRYVFLSQGFRPLGRFILCYVVTYTVNLAALTWLLSHGFGELMGQLILLPFIATLTFAIMKHWVFRNA